MDEVCSSMTQMTYFLTGSTKLDLVSDCEWVTFAVALFLSHPSSTFLFVEDLASIKWVKREREREKLKFEHTRTFAPSRTDHCFTRKPYVFPNPLFFSFWVKRERKRRKKCRERILFSLYVTLMAQFSNFFASLFSLAFSITRHLLSRIVKWERERKKSFFSGQVDINVSAFLFLKCWKKKKKWQKSKKKETINDERDAFDS